MRGGIEIVKGLNKDGFPLRVENAWSPIIDKETFTRVRSMLALRSPKITRPRSINSEYLLLGSK